MDINYTYTKLRKNFGRQPMFCESPVQLIDSLEPNFIERKKYGLRNPVHNDCQVSINLSEHYINTKRVVMTDGGANHEEGGWPKEVNFWDEELTTRYRRRIERDDNYVDAILKQNSKFEHFIRQNNAIDMYGMYFSGMKPERKEDKSSIRLNNIYKDQRCRPISSIDWTFEEDSKMVVSYCNRKYPVLGPINKNTSCFVWTLDNPHSPILEFCPPSSIWQLVCSPTNSSIVMAGLDDGRVCVFDLRTNKQPIAISPMHLAHRNPTNSLLFIPSRVNYEFFSASTDGMVMWWDGRNLSQPTDSLMMAFQIPPEQQPSLAYADGVSVLQFEKTIPTKFLCGTDTGFVVNVNRKGKTRNEMMSAIFKAQKGPIKALHRNPCIIKMFITCGDWTINLWSDDLTCSPIVTGVPQRYQINDVIWAPYKVSSFMTVSSDGNFHYWDILRKYQEPLYSVPVSKSPLLKVKPHVEGKVIALADEKGIVYIYSLSENLVSHADRDKQLMSQIFERETKREHILETRIKELILKRMTNEDGGVVVNEDVIDEEGLTKVAEDDYRKTIMEEIRRTGYSAGTGSRPGGKMRTR